MKMFERFTTEGELILNKFCKIEGCTPSQVKEKTNKAETVELRDKFSAFGYIKGLKPKEISESLNQHRCNFYHSMKKEAWKQNMERYNEILCDSEIRFNNPAMTELA